MKNKTKKILATACLGVVGMGLLTGCSMTDEQMKAIDTLTKNTETLVDSFNKYLDSNNNQLDKNVAFDMLREARIRSTYIVEGSDIVSMNISTKDKLNSTTGDFSFGAILDCSEDEHRFIQFKSDGSVAAIGKTTLDEDKKSYTASFDTDGTINLVETDKGNYANEFRQDADALSQVGIFELSIDDMTNVVYNDGEYTFNITKTLMEEDDSGSEIVYRKRTNLLTIVVKDYLFKSVDAIVIEEEGSELSLSKDDEGNLIKDGYGSYLMSGAIKRLYTLTAEYAYGDDVDLSILNAKIAEVDAKIASGELTF